MAVYVDDAANRLGHRVMYHMFSPDLDALHAMADRIDISRRWFQDPATMPKVSWPHYDIADTRRALAVRYGAIECDRYQTVAMATIVQNIVFGQSRDPLRYFRNNLIRERDRIAAWLADQGYPQ